jgi:hypothetical protein
MIARTPGCEGKMIVHRICGLLPGAMGILVSIMFGAKAYACVGPLDVACNVDNAVQKAGQDVGQTGENALQDIKIGKTLEKMGEAAGKAGQAAGQAGKGVLEKGGQAAGKAGQAAVQAGKGVLEKGGQAAGKAGQAAVQAGERVLHDTGKALEQAGQDLGHFFGQVTNFKLACSLPGSPPASLNATYKDACEGSFNTYKNDLTTCNHAGGASVIASGGVGAKAGVTTVAGGATTFGATYAAAKVAFELCQAACRSHNNLRQCMADHDRKIVNTSTRAQAVAQRNDQQRALLDRAECIDEAYVAEKRVVMQNIVSACEVRKNCNTASPEFTDEFIKAVNENNQAIEKKRQAVKKSYQHGHPISSEFGPSFSSPNLTNIVLREDDTPIGKSVCHVRQQAVHATARISLNPTEKVTVRWTHQGKIISEILNLVPNANSTISTDINLKNEDYGPWVVLFLRQNGPVLGSYGFLYLSDYVE